MVYYKGAIQCLSLKEVNLIERQSSAMIPLSCPNCFTELVSEAEGFRCPACNRPWGKKHGILSFIDNSYSYGGISPEEWEGILADISSLSNEEIQGYFLSRKIKGRWPYIQSFRANKADGLYFLPITDTSIVLDCGCGPGSLSIPIAKRCAHVYAVDATLARLRFMNIRRENDGIENITLIHASALALPFQNALFDHIFLNGVFEYMGEWDTSQKPGEIQQKVLGRLYSLIKPGGFLFLAIENRFGFDFLYRKRDHSHIYATSWMPRRLADTVTRIIKRHPYRTYTYSLTAYESLLKGAGFNTVTTYAAWPSYRDPRYIFPVREKEIFRYYLKNFIHPADKTAYLFYYLADLFKRAAFFFPHYLLIAKKEQPYVPC